MSQGELNIDTRAYPLPYRTAQIDTADGTRLCRTEEELLVAHLKTGAELVKDVMHSGPGEIVTVQRDRSGRDVLVCERPFQLSLLRSLMRFPWETLEDHFPSHSFVPFIKALLSIRASFPELTEDDNGVNSAEVAKKLNLLATELRRKSRDIDFLKDMHRRRRRCWSNLRSARMIVDEVTARLQRVRALRMEFTYFSDTDHFYTGRPNSVSLDEVFDDFAKLLRYARRYYPLEAYIWKLEYGLITGFHFHVLFLLNGHDIKDEIAVGKNFGMYWNGRVTEGRGRHNNCNTNKYYERGVGLIERQDSDKIEILKEAVLGYLLKCDFWLQYEPGRRTFGRSEMNGRRRAKKRR